MDSDDRQATREASRPPAEVHRTGSSRPAWIAALTGIGILLGIAGLGLEGRARSPEIAALPSPAMNPPTEAPASTSDHEERCYCLAIPGPLEPRFEARLIRDGDIVTSVALREGTSDRLTGQITLADGRTTTAVLDLAWSDMQKAGENETVVSLKLAQRYDQFVPGHFRGEFSLDASENDGTAWRYLVRWNTSGGGVLLLMELEPVAAADASAASDRSPGVVVGRRLGSGHPKQ